MTITLTTDYVTETCCYSGCRVQFAFTCAVYRALSNSGEWWYCPHGHRQHYTGKSDTEKLRDAKARESALTDQLGAAVRDAEDARAALVRYRHRFVNGVCPCCNRTFGNVRRHMASQHPDYDVTKVEQHVTRPTYRCTCGRSFDSPRGLRTHQGHMRKPGWEASTSTYAQHLTKV